MRLLDRFKKPADTTDSEEAYDEQLRLETAKVRAYRQADDMVEAAETLLDLAKELREEIEGIDSD